VTTDVQPLLTPEEIARLVAHLPCLERAAADPSASEQARQQLRTAIRETRVTLALLGADLPEEDSK
jgi:hypothetical protein